MRNIPNVTNVQDEQPDYWGKRNAARDARIIDMHFANRSHGQKPQNIKTYAIPLSQQIPLKENERGGMLVWKGGSNAFDPRYLQAQNRVYSKFSQSGDGLMRPVQENNSGWKEVDVGTAMQARLVQGMSQPTGPTHGPLPGNSFINPASQPQSPRVCTLREGLTAYKAVQTGNFGTTQVLAKTAGQLGGAICNTQFEIKGEVQAYVIDGLQTIDLQNPDHRRVVSLVRVQAPMQEALLVPAAAILETANRPQRQLLTDSAPRHVHNQFQQPQQRQLVGPTYQTHQQVTQLPRMTPEQAMTPTQRNVQQMGADLLKRRGLLKG